MPDLFIQIRADRLNITHTVGIEVMDLLRIYVELVEQIRGFRYLDGRDLNGFLYSADNPRGMKRRQVGIIVKMTLTSAVLALVFPYNAIATILRRWE